MHQRRRTYEAAHRKGHGQAVRVLIPKTRNARRLGIPTYDLGTIDDPNSGQPFTWAQNFVDGELIPCYQDDCSQSNATAIQRDSWARIKATFRAKARKASE